MKTSWADGLLAIKSSFHQIVYLTDIKAHLPTPFYCPVLDEMLDYNGPLLNPAPHIIYQDMQTPCRSKADIHPTIHHRDENAFIGP